MILHDGKKLAILVLIATLFVGCTTIRTGSHQDENVSLGDYQSFSWISDDPLILAAGDQAEISPLSKKKIVEAMEKTFRDKGYTYTSNREGADFVVSYTVGTREKIDASSYPNEYDGAWGWHLHGRYYYDTEIRHRSYTEGTLGIDIFDGKTRQPVWHGWATKTISSADRENPSPSITKAVESVLARFPSFAQ